MSDTRVLNNILGAPGRHWVGDGFPVQTLFDYNRAGMELSPFLLLDYAGPTDFPPTAAKLGVGEHPHRGFETVTIVYSGEVEHRDSAGGGGTIGPGDVQWMTAGSGLVHEEFHGRHFARQGGRFEMFQLWVNLPARFKMSKPRYQGIPKSDIPVGSIPGVEGSLRVIAGNGLGATGPAKTHSPLQVLDMELRGGQHVELDVPDGHSLALALRHGEIETGAGKRVSAAQVGIFHTTGSRVCFDTRGDVALLLLSGEPLNEPIAGSGPFVMNTSAEIRQALADFHSGKMGRLG